MRKNKALSWLLLAGMTFPRPLWAGEALLAANVDASFLNSTAFSRFFAAPQVKKALLSAPRAELPMGHGGRSRPIRQRGGRPRSPVIPDPKATAAYRRTFRILESQPEKTDRYDALILRHAQANRLDARFVKAIIAAESEFDARALSPKGARGLMQLMPATAREVGVSGRDLHDPEANIRAGTAYLRVLFSAAWRKYKLKGVRYHDAPPWLLQRIIAAYNAGPRFLSSSRFYPQTRGYVRKVLLYYASGVTDFHRAPKLAYAEPALDMSAGL